jgi:stage V sporulation protein G
VVSFLTEEEAVQITEVRVSLREEEKLKAFANVTFDGAFVVRGLKVIFGDNGFFISMPSRKRIDGTHQDVCHPINSHMRELLETAVLEAYAAALKIPGHGSGAGQFEASPFPA